MDQLVLVVEPFDVSLKMGHEMMQELEAGSLGSGRTHIVVVNRTQTNAQTSWNEVEYILGKELRAIISAAPELAYQAAKAGTPIVMYQPGAIVSNQIVKLTEDVTTRIRSLAGGELTT
jgi:Flp pilus assembly CpaE family ATPase